MIVQKCGDGRVSDEENVSAVSAVSAVWAAKRFEFLAMNRDTAFTAVTGCKVQDHAVDERNHESLLQPPGSGVEVNTRPRDVVP